MSQPPSARDQVRFLRNLQRILEEGQFTASYKFALVHALADLPVQMGDDGGGELRLPVRAIAERFVELYWRQAAPWPAPSGEFLFGAPRASLLCVTRIMHEGQDLSRDEDLVSLAAGDLLEYPGVFELANIVGCCLVGDVKQLCRLTHRDGWSLEESVNQSYEKCRGSSLLKLTMIPLAQLQEANRLSVRLVCGFLDSLEKEIHPGVPVASLVQLQQQVDIQLAMALKIGAEVENRRIQTSPFDQEQRKEQTPDPPVTIPERVDGFELVMDQSQLDEQRIGVRRALPMKVLLEAVESLLHLRDRGGNEPGVLDAVINATSDPTLTPTEVARLFPTAANTPHQHLMHVPNQAKRHGKGLEQVEPMMHRRDVVPDLPRVVVRSHPPARSSTLRFQDDQLLRRGDGPLHAARKDRLAVKQRRADQVGIELPRSRAGQTPERVLRGGEQPDRLDLEIEARGKWLRDESGRASRGFRKPSRCARSKVRCSHLVSKRSWVRGPVSKELGYTLHKRPRIHNPRAGNDGMAANASSASRPQPPCPEMRLYGTPASAQTYALLRRESG
jgi:hypothetical protein